MYSGHIFFSLIASPRQHLAYNSLSTFCVLQSARLQSIINGELEQSIFISRVRKHAFDRWFPFNANNHYFLHSLGVQNLLGFVHSLGEHVKCKQYTRLKQCADVSEISDWTRISRHFQTLWLFKGAGMFIPLSMTAAWRSYVLVITFSDTWHNLCYLLPLWDSFRLMGSKMKDLLPYSKQWIKSWFDMGKERKDLGFLWGKVEIDIK